MWGTKVISAIATIWNCYCKEIMKHIIKTDILSQPLPYPVHINVMEHMLTPQWSLRNMDSVSFLTYIKKPTHMGQGPS
jgi:hypothetical protein